MFWVDNVVFELLDIDKEAVYIIMGLVLGEVIEMKKQIKFQIKELPVPAIALKQGCSCGGSVLVKKIKRAK